MNNTHHHSNPYYITDIKQIGLLHTNSLRFDKSNGISVLLMFNVFAHILIKCTLVYSVYKILWKVRVKLNEEKKGTRAAGIQLDLHSNPIHWHLLRKLIMHADRHAYSQSHQEAIPWESSTYRQMHTPKTSYQDHQTWRHTHTHRAEMKCRNIAFQLLD